MSELSVMELRDRDWEILLRSIENGDCVLLLGPNLDVTSQSGDRINLSQELASILREELGAKAPPNASFSLITQLFENEIGRDDLEIELVRYYRDHAEKHATFDDPVFSALASIPFRTILSLRHDRALQDALSKAGREAKVEHYDFNGNQRDTVFGGESFDHSNNLGTIAQPLVYQLLGTLEPHSCRGSAIITENDLIRFLEAVVSENPKLPSDLTNYLKDKNFLFIGFGMQNFYLRILLHVLKVARSNKSFAFDGPLNEDAKPLSSSFDDTLLFFQSTGFSSLKIMESDPSGFLFELARRWTVRFPEGSFVAPDVSMTAKKAVNRPSVFISYASEDEEKAKELTRILSDEGLDPWLDKEGLRVGSRWNDKLEDTISSDVDFFIVLQSSALSARRESYVHREVKLAIERQDLRPPNSPFIFPLLVDAGAERLDSIERAKIQSLILHDLPDAIPKLAKEIRREHARWQKR